MQGLNNPIGIKSIEPNQNPFITNPYRFAAAGVGGWVELARTTLGSAGDNITVSSLDDKRYYMILHNSTTTGGNSTPAIRLNSDTGSNYSTRASSNGGSDTTATSQSHAGTAVTSTGSNNLFALSYISNLSSKEKLIQTWGTNFNSSGASNAPSRRERVSKWTNTSDVINTITHHNPDTGDYAIGSEIVVLGWDPADTHTSNFWEELASVELGSDSSSSGSLGSPQMETGTFTAKKYLWVQGWIKSSTDFVTNFNSNSSSIFSHRYSDNGGSDGTSINSNSAWFHYGGDQMFVNAFIINDTSKEKLMINHIVYRGSSGAGTAPQRREIVSKWANTSDQITSIQLWKASMTISAGSTLKVWGSD